MMIVKIVKGKLADFVADKVAASSSSLTEG